MWELETGSWMQPGVNAVVRKIHKTNDQKNQSICQGPDRLMTAAAPTKNHGTPITLRLYA
ncbi:hypothetical protein N7478_008549 [Penicillium angulare]|uniref:uncharacterized protein n=1 Tax=Penicillium angulare TaxID=116970 RepID=UPI0025414FB9|nr:uncharacterized protein N7478_008549 [Penicillium angulare]KAJ5273424.1 hypothetical protein N7478_008549 [Penicillium angulare]